MALPDDVREANMWQPGQSGNPAGNFDRHSTRPIAKRIAELFEEGIPADFEVDERFKSKKAKDALLQALFERAVKGETSAAKLLIEHTEGKEQSIDLTTKGEKINSSSAIDKLSEIKRGIEGDRAS